MEELLDSPKALVKLFFLKAKPTENLRDEEINDSMFQESIDDQPIQCCEIDAISGFSYAYLLAESFSAGKGLIIARVKTRSNVDFNMKFYHYFYAANLIQLLVKPNLSFLENIINQN